MAEAGIFEGSSRQKTPMKLLMLGWWWHRLRIFNSFLRARRIDRDSGSGEPGEHKGRQGEQQLHGVVEAYEITVS